MEKITLDNGIEVYLDHVKQAKTIGLYAEVGIGDIYEPEKLRGVSHLIEHLSYHENLPTIEKLGGIGNAFTFPYKTIYFFDCIRKNFEKCTKILYSALENCKFSEEKIKAEKNAIFSETYPQSPEQKLLELIPLAVYGNSDYGNVRKEYETVLSIGKEEIEKFKESYYTCDNIRLWLCGNFSTKLVNKIKRIFENFEREKSKKKKLPSKGKGKDILENLSLKNIWFSENFKVKKPETKEEFLKYFTFLKAFIQGCEAFFSVEKEFRRKGICYSPEFREKFLYPEEIVCSVVLGEIPNKSIEETESEVLEVIENIKNGKYYTKEYIKAMENRIEFIYAYGKETIQPWMRFTLMDEIILNYRINPKNLKKEILKYLKSQDEIFETAEKVLKESKKVILL